MPAQTRRFGATRHARASLLLVAVLAVAATPTLSGVAAASPQDQLTDKRAAAERLEAQIAETGTRISMLDEQFNATQLEIDKARDGIADTERRLDAAAARTDALQAELADRAAALYMGAANGTAVGMMDASDVNELASRSKYGSAAADEDETVIDELSVAKEDLAEARTEFEKSRAKAESKKEELESTRSEIQAAQDEHEALLSETKGEIASLVATIEKQRQAEEERRARAEFEQQAREQAAESAAASASADSGGGSSSSDGGGSYALPTPVPNGGAGVAVSTAMAQLGKPYEYAASGPNSFDCSGLTMFAWAAAGVGLPHSSQAQYASLPHVSQGQLVPGDLVFYGSPIHHVGMYIGGGQYVHAPHTGDVVKVASAFRGDYVGGARPG